MRDFRDAKAMAQTLRAALAAMDFKITVSQSLELMAKVFGAGDWNTLSATIHAQAILPPEKSPPPLPSAETAPIPGKRATTPPRKPLSGELESALTRAFAYAKAHKHEEVTVEHLLASLLDDAEAARVMTAIGVNLDDLRGKLADYIDTDQKSRATFGEEPPRPTLGFQRVLQRAVFHVQQADRYPVKTLDALVAIFSEKQSAAVRFLNEQHVIRIDVVNYITWGIVKGQEGSADTPAAT